MQVQVLVLCIFPFIDLLGTIDFVLADGTVVFRTCDAEKQNVVFQMVCTSFQSC